MNFNQEINKLDGGSNRRVKNNSRQNSNSNKEGGALMDDIKNLAVPFAILLAKQGLDGLFTDKKDKKTTKEKKTKTTKTVKEPKEKKETASKPASKGRRGTLAGGGCGGQCGAMQTPVMTGGRRQNNDLRIQERFNNIAREIEQFLQRY